MNTEKFAVFASSESLIVPLIALVESSIVCKKEEILA
jgi:hypothetical protein